MYLNSKVGKQFIRLEQPDRYHRIAEQEKIPNCKLITWAVGAGIAFFVFYILFTMTPIFDHLLKR